MTNAQPGLRIHPLIAVAAVSVTLVSLMGIAALTGVLPSSHGLTNDAPRVASQVPSPQVTAPEVARNTGSSTEVPKAVRRHTPPATTGHENVVAVDRSASPSGAQQPTSAQQQQQPQQQAAAQRVSPVGIGVGAVIGGLLGNQVGSGNGKTLATIAGAVGGGYIGNEVAKRNQ